MDITYQFDCKKVSTPELVELFKAAGLGGRTGEKILRAFKNSQLVCLAYAGARLVGTSRAITDWEYHALIYDVAVHPEYQGLGHAKRPETVQKRLNQMLTELEQGSVYMNMKHQPSSKE